MNTILCKISILLMVCFVWGNNTYSQSIPEKITQIGRAEDTTALMTIVTKDNVNTCYDDATALIILIRQNARKCIDKLIRMGADINKGCGEAKVPIFHVVKHCNLEMFKYFESKGANLNATYKSEYSENETLLEYAKRYNKQEIVGYLESK
jgi:ankyrin repeat protein